MTWVSSEPWGYAPYHSGRWANVGNQWYWVPEAVNTTPVYSPALVAFVPFNDANQIGWVPLGPGDAYAPRYYDANWQPYYLTQASVTPAQLVNLAVPNAVTVVPVDYLQRPIDRRLVNRVDAQQLAQVRPTLEPLALTPLRNAAIHSAWGRGKIDLPPGIAKKLNDTRVVVGATPTAPPFRKDLAKSLRVDTVPERAKNQKFNVKDERQNGSAAASRRGNVPQVDAGQQQQVAAEAARGNRDAQHQMKQVQQQERKLQSQQQQTERRAAQQAQGARVSQPAARQPAREIMRQPQRAQPEQRRAAPAQPRLEARPQPRAPQAMSKPERQQRAQPPARQAQPQPRQMQAPQRQAPPQQQQRAAPPQKNEKHGPPAQSQGQPGGGGGKGHGKKP